MENIETIIENLQKIEHNDQLDYWSLEDKKKLLELYWIISKKEKHIFDLIYQNHGCDSWEDIFRDFESTYLTDKARGVKIAIDEITQNIEETKLIRTVGGFHPPTRT